MFSEPKLLAVFNEIRLISNNLFLENVDYTKKSQTNTSANT